MDAGTAQDMRLLDTPPRPAAKAVVLVPADTGTTAVSRLGSQCAPVQRLLSRHSRATALGSLHQPGGRGPLHALVVPTIVHLRLR